MSVIAVNGTNLQIAVNAAQAGDTLNIAAGGYGAVKISKPLHLRGSGVVIEGVDPGNDTTIVNTVEFTPTAPGSSMVGDFMVRGAFNKHGANMLLRADDVVLDGLTTEESEAGYGIRHYLCDRATIRNWTARKVAFALQFNGKASGSVLEDFTFVDIDHMIVDDTAPGNDTGGTGIDFFKTVGPTVVRRGKMTNLRSTHSYDYVRDGGAIAAYGGAKNVTVEDVEIHDALNVFEDGRASTDPDNANFVFRRVKAYGRPGAMGADKATQCQGVLVRSMQGFVWEDFYFEDLDGFGNFLFDKSGNYAGGLGGVSLKGEMKLKPGAFAYIYNPNVPLNVVTLADVVTYTDASKAIARVAGKGDTNSLSQFRTWGAQAPTEVWRPSETEVQRLTRELVAMTTQRDVLSVSLAASQAEVSRLKTIIDEAEAKLAQAD